MLLNKPKKYSRSPFLRMIIVKLRRLSHLNLIRILIINLVSSPNYHMQYRHPTASQSFNLWINFIMNSFPKEFNAQIYQLILLMFSDELQQNREDNFYKFKEIVSFLLSYAELKTRSTGQKNVEEGNHIFLFFNSLNDRNHRQPGLVLYSYYDCKNLFINFYKFVDFITSNDGQQQCIFD